MAYRNKTFVSFDGDNDIRYYRLMKAWKQGDKTPFNFIDAHDINTALDSSMEATIKSRLRQRLANAKVFVLLVGERTRYLYKFIRWEIEQAMARDIPIIVVNLNGLRQQDPDRCPPILRDELAIHISFNASILQHALENWTVQHNQLPSQGGSGPYYYNESVYRSLGL